jgi:hypothetical protein
MDIKKWKFRLGIILIFVSVMIFLMLFALPFLSMDLKIKIGLSTSFIIAGEVAFWIGIILIGKEVYLKLKAKLLSGEWLEKKKNDDIDGLI